MVVSGAVGAVLWPICVLMALIVGYYVGVNHGENSIAYAPEEGGNLPPEAIEADIPVVDLTQEAAKYAAEANSGTSGTGNDPNMPSDADVLDASPVASLESTDGADADTNAVAPEAASPAVLPDGERPLLTSAIVYETATRILPKFEKVAKETGYQSMGILFSEGLLLCATAVAAQVDVILESGTAGRPSLTLL